jgi:hypothetical protein
MATRGTRRRKKRKCIARTRSLLTAKSLKKRRGEEGEPLIDDDPNRARRLGLGIDAVSHGPGYSAFRTG